MTDKLGLYNRALLYLGERPIASLAEDRKPRRALDVAFNTDFINEILSEGLWNFAAKRDTFTAEPPPAPLGFSYAFEKPADWIRTYSISTDASFESPLLNFEDEQGYWLADSDTIYVKYVSNDDEYGGNLSLWSPKFTQYAAAMLAAAACSSITQDTGKEEKLRNEIAPKLLSKAKGVDGSNEPPRPRISGSWVRSRMGRGQDFSRYIMPTP